MTLRDDADTPVDAAPRPHDNCYWLLPGRLLAGEYPAPHLQRLIDAGVTRFVDLTAPRDRLTDYAATLPSGVARQSLPITDFGVPSVALMREILAAIDVALDAKQRVYLHCHGGIGRTGTVAGCWLVEQGFSSDEALALIARKWQVMAKRSYAPHSPETAQQREFIARWASVKSNVG